jgi:hypothetical protein
MAVSIALCLWLSDHGGVRDLLTVRTCCQATVIPMLSMIDGSPEILQFPPPLVPVISLNKGRGSVYLSLFPVILQTKPYGSFPVIDKLTTRIAGGGYSMHERGAIRILLYRALSALGCHARNGGGHQRMRGSLSWLRHSLGVLSTCIDLLPTIAGILVYFHAWSVLRKDIRVKSPFTDCAVDDPTLYLKSLTEGFLIQVNFPNAPAPPRPERDSRRSYFCSC